MKPHLKSSFSLLSYSKTSNIYLCGFFMSTVQGLNPPTPYTGTDTTQIEINFLETYVDQLLTEVMPGGVLAGSSPFMPGDTIGSGAGSYQGGGEVGQVLQLVQQLLQQIAMYEGQSGSSQAPWSPFSSQGAAPNQGAPKPPPGGGTSQVAAGPSQVAAGVSQGVASAGSSFAPYGGPQSSLSSYSGAGHTVAAGNITPENIDKMYGSTISADVAKYNKEYGTSLTVAFVEGIVYQESKGDPLAESTDGQDSKGLMQMSTASGFDIADILSPGGNQFDPNVSLDSGIHLLAIMDQPGAVPGSELGGFYGTSFQGAGGNLALLASKFQGGANTAAVSPYGTKIMGWMTDFANGTPPPETA
jgi:hypothetical protein